MNWMNILSEISGAGLSQAAIARALRISQPSVSDLANGKTKNPSWPVGERILKLHKKYANHPRRAA